MKVAKASAEDLKMALELASALEALTHRWVPAMPEQIARSEADGYEPFDVEDPKQCRRVCDYLLGLASSASLFRVVMGMCVLLDPTNAVVDPDADTLEHHPDRERDRVDAACFREQKPRPADPSA